MRPNVTVVIVNWNGERFLHRCLSALLAQTVAPNEVIVIDNASTDMSLDVVRHYPAVRLLAQGTNLGFASGNNVAVAAAAASSEWIALLNPDAFVEPRWLETLLAAAQEFSEFDVFASKLVTAANPALLDGAGDVVHASGLVWRKGHGAAAAGATQDGEVFSPCAAAAMYRRTALAAVGGFDEDFFCYCEDVDLGFRLRLAGYRCRYVPDSVAHHVGSGTTGGQHSNFAVYHGHRNLVWVYVKNMPGVLLWLLLPLHLAMNVLTVLAFILRGQGRVILRAKWDAAKGLPGMWHKRRPIQSSRVATVGQIWRALDKRVLPRRRARV